jgi:hypothetical protein
VSFDFSRLKTCLSRVTAEHIVGTMPTGSQRYPVFGEERFTNGSAFICIDEADGSVRRIDVELDEPVSIFSTSATQFASTFRLFDDFFASGVQSPAELARRLRAADTQGFDAGSHWRLLSDYLR